MKKYYIGLDIGTDSVGIACTDEEYNLLRIKGKDAWAVRLFDEAQDASGRRTKRSMRRRLARRKQRIDFLQELFAPYLEDKLFFIRLNNSAFWAEDKDGRLDSKFSLFSDEDFTDVDFHKRYPTIFHLRRALIEHDSPKDLRLYYLALHHIIKYRGHFLFPGESMNDVGDIGTLFNDINEACEMAFSEDPPKFDVSGRAEEFKNLAITKSTISDKKQKFREFFEVTKTQKAKSGMLDLLAGGTAKLSDVFDKEEYKEGLDKDDSCKFSDMTDDQLDKLSQEIDEEDFEVLDKLKRLYDYILFARVLKKHTYISDAMIEIYDKHKQDLKKLKTLLRESGLNNEYRRIFKQLSKEKEKIYNYVRYIGYSKIGGKKVPVKKLKAGEFKNFYTFLSETLEGCRDKIVDQNTLNEILDELKSEDCQFLPKILNADNGTFPHQINGIELNAILENLCKDYPQFCDVGEDGISTAEKIRKIFTFRIPYYVGPLNTYHSESLHGLGGNSWMVRTSEDDKERITPWNFDDKVDKAKSNDEFIRRMTNKCTYLFGKDVLPKNSIIYQTYNVLNQLNKLQINERPMSTELKQDIFNDVFLKEKKVTKKKIKQYLLTKGLITRDEVELTSLSGIDGDEFACSMSSYIALKNILGDFMGNTLFIGRNFGYKNLEVVEDIILYHTVNTDDKSIVAERIEKKYGNIPEIHDNIKRLKGLSFKDFGRLSKEFLCETYGGSDPGTGEVYTLLGELWNTNCNLNELLNSDKYSFLDEIKKLNSGQEESVTYKSIEEMYVSPKVRRGIWQALQMTDEYVSALGYAPEKIFVEVTRHDEEKKRKDSRKKKIEELYRELGKTAADINELNQELKGKNDAELRSERLYLYFMQCGRCAYSGEKIDLGILATDLYDVDHIVPRSLVKDDSIDNKVLVRKDINNSDKRANYPIPEDVVSPNMRSVWKMWHEKGLISDKKYALLSRRGELQSADFEGFINRQLVETDQSAKAVAELLKRKYNAQGTKIVYSKATYVSEFRQIFDIVKCRETNDLHHARDAYLNIVVGNVYDTRFSSPRSYYYSRNADSENSELRAYNREKMFKNWNTKGAWDKDKSIVTVKQVCAKTSMTVTRYAYTNTGAFYDETVYPATEGRSKYDTRGQISLDAPRKKNMPAEKYGGFSSLKTAYFAVVDSVDNKGKKIRTMENVPVLVDYETKGDETKLLRYFESKGLVSPQIIVPKLKIKSLLSVDGTLVWIAGITGNRITLHNATQWFTDADTDKHVKDIVKILEAIKNGTIDEKCQESVLHALEMRKISAEKNISLYDAIVRKLKGEKDGNKQRSLYGGISGLVAFRNTLESRRDDFIKCSLLDQIKVLKEIIKTMHCNAENSDLSLLHEGKSCGITRIGKNITGRDIRIIDQSPCGLTRKVRKI